MNNVFGNQANAMGFNQGHQLLSPSEIPVLDNSYLDEIAELQQNGEPDLVGSIIDIFVENTPNSLSNLRFAFVRGNIEAVRKTAHSLKSSCGNIGAASMSHASMSLERLDPYNNEEAAKLIIKIESEFELVKMALRKKMGERS